MNELSFSELLKKTFQKAYQKKSVLERSSKRGEIYGCNQIIQQTQNNWVGW